MYLKKTSSVAACLCVLSLQIYAGSSIPEKKAGPMAPEKKQLLDTIINEHGLSKDQSEALKTIFDSSSVIGQGNPAVTKHPVSKEQCLAQVKAKNITFTVPNAENICGSKYMVPLYDPTKQKPEDATACIDQFEYPNIPCEYPVVWTKASEAQQICAAEGKRLCDAHEWEGACDGTLNPPDYDFTMTTGVSPNTAVERMRRVHNTKFGSKKTWAYGSAYKKGACAADSTKAGDCNGGDWKRCGSNTYPSGYFPECKSSLGVYDQHGNAAEHMNLPLDPKQMTSTGSTELGYTEMKGSWFIFDKYYAHQDWCRWRAPYWHGSKVMDPKSHHNYHLGFRCCNTVTKAKATSKLESKSLK